MKRFVIAMLALLPFGMSAQLRPSLLYDEMCDPLQSVFCDYIDDAAETRYISNDKGQYVGTLVDNALYGWGFYLSSSGAQSFGQYRNNKMIFGLVMSDEIAKVGGEENYVVYDLRTGEIKRLHTNEGDVPLVYPFAPSDSEPVSPYSFKKEVYSNGDVYYGEFYEGRRHGYGVYCWANGDMWYGRYRDGYRNGYGMLVKPSRMVYYGKWVGDSMVSD